MRSRKRPRNETIEGGRLRLAFGKKAWGMLMITNSIIVIILNSMLLSITEEVRECTGQ